MKRPHLNFLRIGLVQISALSRGLSRAMLRNLFPPSIQPLRLCNWHLIQAGQRIADYLKAEHHDSHFDYNSLAKLHAQTLIDPGNQAELTLRYNGLRPTTRKGRQDYSLRYCRERYFEYCEATARLLMGGQSRFCIVEQGRFLTAEELAELLFVRIVLRDVTEEELHIDRSEEYGRQDDQSEIARTDQGRA